MNIVVWSATRTLRSWSSVTKKCLVLHAKATTLRGFFLFSAIRAMGISRVHTALPAVLVVPPAVGPAVFHNSVLTPRGATSENPLSLLLTATVFTLGYARLILTVSELQRDENRRYHGDH